MSKTKQPKIASAWDLLRASLREYRANWKPYVLVLSYVALPANMVALFNFGTADSIAQSYISFASVIMNVALIWAIAEREKSGTVSKVPAAYYDGSAAIVRFLLVSLALVAMLIPAALGASLYTVSLQSAQYTGSYGPELVVVAIVAFLLALPSLYLVARYGLAPFAVIRDNLRPVAALKLARRNTLGRFWAIVGRFVLMVVFLVVLLAPAMLAYFLFSFLNVANLAAVVFNIIATLTVLPIANIYLMRLYRALEHARTAE